MHRIGVHPLSPCGRELERGGLGAILSILSIYVSEGHCRIEALRGGGKVGLQLVDLSGSLYSRWRRSTHVAY